MTYREDNRYKMAGQKSGKQIFEGAQQVWVAFGGETDLPWLKVLKPGFRHCFVLINDGQCWVTYDPMSHYTEITVHHVPAFFDMPGWMAGRGYTMIEATLDHAHTRPAPLSIYSCVGAVKRVLGIHRRFILTPWQLYRHLLVQRSHLQEGGAPLSALHSFNHKEIFHGQSYIAA